ncbi:2-phosphosulfolactate phosphatase [Ornithinibacillus salinisoli]|uniref:Probable 2-phosphosulfolactate phosphatase n=1 Tax=Ornithinibacillus salinisoli TaxID=1848459 RepID=A0ABW4W441_9BACI
MDVQIYQGRNAINRPANITIVIDVLRAFTVAHYAFLRGVQRILLAETVEQAFQIKEKNPSFLLAGEVDGIAIKGFDLDNSPYLIQQKKLSGKTLVQKTTNGVRATLNCLASDHVYVTGFTNARNTAEFIRENLINGDKDVVHIIASHPSGDDDYACAEYMKHILEDADVRISVHEVKERIKNSHVAKKFFDENNPDFRREDVLHCLVELNTNFIMKVDNSGEIPMIERVQVC